MDSLTLTFAAGFEGTATGVPTNGDLEAPLAGVTRTALSGASKQVYEQFATPLTVAPSTTTTLDLTTGLTNPLNESIASSAAFAHVFGVLVQHDRDSAASTITVFNAASNAFQGPKSAGASEALSPGMWTGFGQEEDLTGWSVDGTHKAIAITNNSATQSATVKVIILGTTN
jgi:hypothetical protein